MLILWQYVDIYSRKTTIASLMLYNKCFVWWWLQNQGIHLVPGFPVSERNGLVTRVCHTAFTWWRHQMETFSALLALCAGNSLVTGEFPAQWPVTRNFDVFFYLHLKKRLSKQSGRWCFGTPSRSLWRHCNDLYLFVKKRSLSGLKSSNL